MRHGDIINYILYIPFLVVTSSWLVFQCHVWSCLAMASHYPQPEPSTTHYMQVCMYMYCNDLTRISTGAMLCCVYVWGCLSGLIMHLQGLVLVWSSKQ